MGIIHTAERISGNQIIDNYVFQRCLFPYRTCADMISGSVLEIGTGEGYGVKEIAPRTVKFVTIDKYCPDNNFSEFRNVEFKQMRVPPFKNISDNSFDYAVSFQVIEHIRNDNLFVKELKRVLKKGGKAIITTPNKKMSLTRNPWHIREYTANKLESLLLKHFTSVKKSGVFGNNTVMAYYEENKKAIKKLTKYDIFNLQYRLPGLLLKLPYDLLNIWNRNKLLKSNNTLTTSITVGDFYMKEADDFCLDFFFIATN